MVQGFYEIDVDGLRIYPLDITDFRLVYARHRGLKNFMRQT